MAMAIHNKVTESKFNAIKLLVKGGATNAEAAEYMQVSPHTIANIKAAETWEEYRSIIAARVLAEKQKRHAQAEKAEKAVPAADIVNKVNNTPETPEKVQRVVHEQSVTIQATHYMMQEMQKTNELLKLISNKLAFIVDELTK
jgi:hypothetical protein